MWITPSAKRRSPGRRALPVLIAAVLVLLSGCGLRKKTQALFGGKLPLVVEVDRRVNQDNPLAVDLLLVYKKPTLEKLLELSASEWFEQREQFTRDHQQQIRIWSWEWVPGQQVPARDLLFKLGAKGGVVFADYYTPGKHRALIDPREPIRISFKEAGFEVAPLKEKKRKKPKTKEH